MQTTRLLEGAPDEWAYLGLVKTGRGKLAFLAERTSADHLRFTIVNGLSGDDTVQLRWTKTPCGRSTSSSSVVYSDTFPAAAVIMANTEGA